MERYNGNVAIFYHLIALVIDILALRRIARRDAGRDCAKVGGLATGSATDADKTTSQDAPAVFAWCCTVLYAGVGLVLAGVLVGGLFENHFGVFRLWAYGVFLYGPILLIGTGMLWWRKRRQLALAAMLAGVGVLLFAGYIFLIEPFWLDVSYVEIRSGKIEHRVRIVVVADLQTDRIGGYEKAAFQRVMDEKPDIILLAGDYLQTSYAYREALQNELNGYLKSIRFGAADGAYAVRGNTDPAVWQRPFSGLEITATDTTRSFAPAGIELTCLSLANSRNPKLRVSRRFPERFHVVLGHIPNFALGDVDADLLVAGHTHGGQLRLPVIGPVITHSVIPNSWAYGLTPLSDERNLLVSRGIGMERGTAPRFRFNCRPELVVVDLVPEAK